LGDQSKCLERRGEERSRRGEGEERRGEEREVSM